MIKNFCSSFLFALMIPTTFAQTPTTLEAQRDLFIRAEHALKTNDHTRYEQYANQLQDYPLYPYLVAENMKQQMLHSQPLPIHIKNIDEFEQQYPDFPQSLRTTWLQQLAQHKQWTEFLNGYPKSNNNKSLTCYYLQAKLHTDPQTKIGEEAKTLWLTSAALPDSCTPVFKAWKKQGGLSEKLIWERIQLAFAAKNMDLAHDVAKLLSGDEKTRYQEWEKTLKDPQLLLEKTWLDQLSLSDTGKAALFKLALPMLAKKDAEEAMQWWKQNESAYTFTAAQKASILRDIGMYLAHQRSPYARTWLAAIPDAATDQTVQEWRVRLALNDQDYRGALLWIRRLPQALQNESIWRYWKARILANQNQVQHANEIFAKLATERSYYGFLAASRLNLPIQLNHQAKNIPPDQLAAIQAIPGIQRFNELMALQRPNPARTEWFKAIDKLSNADKIAAATIANRMQLYDIAIFTMNKTDYKDDVNVRFPLAFKTQILAQAKKQDIDPAWVFAITRQESAFHTDATSPVGALGLMQLMPTTAKSLAKNNQIPYPNDAVLRQAGTNLMLGTVYLHNLKERMQNNGILAAAAYNAGPTRANSWLPAQSMEADIWIENIPFKETREYVKNIVTFTNIYRRQLNMPPAMTMTPIPAKG